MSSSVRDKPLSKKEQAARQRARDRAYLGFIETDPDSGRRPEPPRA
jgi:hypothetical protein